MSNKCPIILLAEPEENIRESIKMVLIDEGYDCHAVCNKQALLRAIHIYKSDLIIADIHTIYDDIPEILLALNCYKMIPHLLVSVSYERIRDMLYLMNFGITEYLVKPFSFEELLERIQKTITPKPHTPI